MSVKCKLILKDVENIARQLNLHLDADMISYISQKTEETLLGIINEAEKNAKNNRHKTVSKDDVICVISSRSFPFHLS